MAGFCATPPLFSIITVCKNNHAGLLQTESSLRCQNWNDFEWLVADGGNVEQETGLFLSSRSPYRSPFLAWWDSCSDKGPYDAMNRAIEHAHGEYIIFLNAGDCLAHPEILSLLAEIILRSSHNRPDFLYGHAVEQLPTGVQFLKTSRHHRALALGMFTHHQAMVYRRDRIGDLRFPLAYRIGADYAFTALFLKKSHHIVRVNLPICIFLSGGLAHRHPEEGRRDQHYIRKAFLGIPAPLGIFILWLQSLSFFLRKHCLGLYSYLRFRRVNAVIPKPKNVLINHQDDMSR